MWQIKWLRRLVRRHTRPVPLERATTMRDKLSIGYAFIAWNAFGVVCYMIYTGRKDWAKYYGYKTEADELVSPGKQWAKTLSIKNANIVRVSGFHITSQDRYSQEEETQTQEASNT